MHALVLSTTLSEGDFALLLKKGNHANPSNQHFYSSFIKMLAVHYNVDVFSYRPLTIFKNQWIKKEESERNGICFHYLSFLNVPKIKSLQIAHYSLKKIRKYIHSDTILFVDSLNIALVKLAFRISKKFHLPIVGIITDHPKNITGVTKKYIRTIESYFPKYDLYYALTEGLNEASNLLHRPCFIKEGLIDEKEAVPAITRLYDNYIFFGGALYEKYGISALLEAFHRYPTSHHLIIAGQGPSVSLVKDYALKDPRIHYVGLLSKKEIAFYEQNALLNINPRPLNKELEALSFPSKMLEYIASGTPTMTTENETIQKMFQDTLFYIGSGKEHEIYNGFVDFFELSEKEREKKAQQARKIALSHYAISKVAQEFDSFIRLHSSSSNFFDNKESVK